MNIRDIEIKIGEIDNKRAVITDRISFLEGDIKSLVKKIENVEQKTEQRYEKVMKALEDSVNKINEKVDSRGGKSFTYIMGLIVMTGTVINIFVVITQHYHL